jgi:hypothetical protein
MKTVTHEPKDPKAKVKKKADGTHGDAAEAVKKCSDQYDKYKKRLSKDFTQDMLRYRGDKLHGNEAKATKDKKKVLPDMLNDMDLLKSYSDVCESAVKEEANVKTMSGLAIAYWSNKEYDKVRSLCKKAKTLKILILDNTNIGTQCEKIKETIEMVQQAIGMKKEKQSAKHHAADATKVDLK